MTTPIGNPTTAQGGAASLGTYDDAMSALYTTLSEARQNDMTVGESRVEENEVQQQRDEAQQREALRQEQANQANSGGGFFSDIGHLFCDVASDLAHGHFGSAIDDGARDVDNAWNSPKFWSDLKTGLEDVAIVATAVTTVVTTAGVGTVAAAAVGAIAGGGAGLAGARVDHFAASAADASADATAAGDDVQQLQQVVADVVADLKQTDQSHQRALASLTQSIQTHDDTLVTASSMTVKG